MSYQTEKFNVARSNLMLPHPRGEDASIAEAMFNVTLGLNNYQMPDDFNEDAARQLRELQGMMLTDGLEDPNREGLHSVLARTMDVDQRHRFSTLVDELAWWFAEYDRRGA
ncbi:hypothetical protein [Xanthomonas vasicola]|uniref:hypothetical protein n=1 Tax=Xanthomonas vasicola TaxID=56459 RepID=UPI000530E10B|nr:hypothetical protein [Xanthomonas vasicola]KGR44446.1 hypothetical protein NX04_06880 [Xanthomonas vasicola]TWQ40735.1 hypothetical protein FQJ96_06175 [Xanthomonas vasicola]TWQ61130.1 hypothetical protein FQJ93_04000 [Xanthomonas vasicola]TWQ71418.1 hypothetical protein FQJ89_22265 [Xanthomonas vasicola]